MRCGKCQSEGVALSHVKACYGQGTLLPVKTLAQTVTDIPAGRYAVVQEDESLKFYRVDRPEKGKWAGRTFVNQLVGSSMDFRKIPVRSFGARTDVLLQIVAQGIKECAEKFGKEVGRCCRCGATLTDEESRTLGIGPDCIKAWGWAA